ncbi:MAG: VWA domain-containing protein [Planctomycetaceae bacterium]|nr:VWA domain-containing protein [Planctomycetaceae bacterium]
MQCLLRLPGTWLAHIAFAALMLVGREFFPIGLFGADPSKPNGPSKLAADAHEKAKIAPSSVVPPGKMTVWLQAPDEKKRLAALREVSWGSPTDPEVVAAIEALVRDAAKRKTITESGHVALGVLARCPLPEADIALGTALQAADWRARVVAASAIAQRESGGMLTKELLACWRSPMATQHYALRHAVVCALSEADDSTGIAATIDLLQQLDGQLKFEAVARLTQRTGQDLGDEGDAWETWWRQRPTGWTPMILSRADLPEDVAWKEPVPEFFGVKIYAKRVLFVVDVSSSMRSTLDGKTRILTAQEELQRAISALPEDGWFNVIFYNEQVYPWRPTLVQATADNRLTALQKIFSIDPEGATALNDAMEMAVDFPTPTITLPGYIEQVLLLTDGKPTAGRITAPEAIVANISARNILNRTRIDTLGIDSSDSPEELLRQLAQQNFGKYHRLR